MFYSLICITYLTPFFIVCNLRNSLNTPAISYVVKISNTYNVNIYNVYVPNLGNDKKIFINQLISMNPAEKNIVMGDFNCIFLKGLDRKPIPKN